MQDRRANIDLVFRNGLRNLEVLPPPGVWNEISPVTVSGARRRLFTSVAASVAVLALMASALWLASDMVPTAIGPGAFTLNQDVRPSGSLNAATETAWFAPDRGEAVQPTLLLGGEQVPAINITQEQTEGYEPEGTVDKAYFPAGGTDMAADYLYDDLQYLEPGIPSSMFESFSDEVDLSPVRQKVANRWQLTMGMAPSLILKPAGGDTEMAKMLDSEKGFISYNGGVTVSFSFSNRLSVSTGLHYSSVGSMIEDIATYTGFSPYIATKGRSDMTVSTSSGTIVIENPDLYLTDRASGRVSTAYGRDVFDPVKADLPYAGGSMVQNFGYLELPVMLRYKLVDRMVDFNLIGGISYGLMVSNSVHASTISGERIEVGRTEGVSPFNITSTMGVGMAYNLSGTLTFNIEPLMRYNVSSLGTESATVPNPWSIGLFTGFSFRF